MITQIYVGMKSQGSSKVLLDMEGIYSTSNLLTIKFQHVLKDKLAKSIEGELLSSYSVRINDSSPKMYQEFANNFQIIYSILSKQGHLNYLVFGTAFQLGQ